MKKRLRKDGIATHMTCTTSDKRLGFLCLFCIIGIFCLQLSSCTGSPRRYLTLDASLIKKGDTMAQVLDIMGPPDARQIDQTGQEEWYYYVVHRHFYQKLPLLGRFLGNVRVEALQVVFVSNRVIKVLYYVPEK